MTHNKPYRANGRAFSIGEGDMIVKVQTSLFTSKDQQQVLVYNKDRSIYYEGNATKKLLRMMSGRFKAFFKAKLEKDGSLTIIKPAKEQDW